MLRRLRNRKLLREFFKNRGFGAEQMTGSILIFGALVMYLRPQSITFSSIEITNHWSAGILAFVNILLMVSCGITLIAVREVEDALFLLLTIPFILIAVLQVINIASMPNASLESSYLIVAFHLFLQWAHNRFSLLQKLLRKLNDK